jgi:hypothetical protein
MQANTAAATALVTFALDGYGLASASRVSSLLTSVLITIALDMALRSLGNKLQARYAGGEGMVS